MIDDAKDKMLHHAILVITTGVAFSPSTRSTGTQPLTAAHPSCFFLPFYVCVRAFYLPEIPSRSRLHDVAETGIVTLSTYGVHWPIKRLFSFSPFLFFFVHFSLPLSLFFFILFILPTMRNRIVRCMYVMIHQSKADKQILFRELRFSSGPRKTVLGAGVCVVAILL